MAAKILVERLEPDLERAAGFGVPLEHAENLGRDRFGFLPMALIPFLEQADLRARDADIEFDIVAKSGVREIG